MRPHDDEYYDLEAKDGPHCQVRVEFRESTDGERFRAVVGELAAEFGFVECPEVAWTPPFPSPMHTLPQYWHPDLLFKGFYILRPDTSYGQAGLLVLHRRHPRATFERRVQTFVARFQETFPGQVHGGRPFWLEPKEDEDDAELM